MLNRLIEQAAVWRSLALYYAVPGRLRRMRDFYRPLIRPGDLCFDIGAHVGNRIYTWRRLGARVVGVEPQPPLMAWLRRFYGDDPAVTLVEAAVGDTPGTATLFGSRGKPTVASLSRAWIHAVNRDRPVARVHWNTSFTVRVTTLDDLIAAHGVPALCKIDVEGFEPAVLAGLSRPLRTVSFEYIPVTVDLARDCIQRLAALGEYEYNWFVGERHRWESERWLTPDAMAAELDRLRDSRPSGDIFARLREG